jgi:hypothetical protein
MKSFTQSSLPKLNESQCYIILAEVQTGIILNLDEKYNLEPDEYPILLFDSYDDARNFAEKKITENSEIECLIFNFKKEFIERIFKKV